MSSKDDGGAAAGSGLVSTAELAAALSVLPDPVFIMKAARDSHGTVVELEYEFLNEASARLLGRPVGPLVGIGLSEVFPTVRELGIFDRYVAVIDSASPVMFDVPWFQEGGVEGSFRLTASRFGDGLLVSASDITDVVRARQEAEAARAYLRATADSLLDPLVRFEAVRDEAGQIADFRFADANSAACAYVEIPYEHLVGTRMLEHYPRVVSAGLLRQCAHVVETGEPLMLEDVTYPMETMGGQDRHLDVSAARVDDGLSFTWRDVTQQRQAFEAAQRLAAIVESSDDAIFRRNPDGIITSWNPGAEKMFGYSSAEVVGTSTDLLIPEDRRAEVKPILATIGTGRSVEHLETTRVGKDGTEVPVSVSVSPVCDADGAVVGASVICRDVTEQRRALEISQRMSAIVESTDDAIISSTPAAIISSWNPAAERMYGYRSGEVIGKPGSILVPEDRRDEIANFITKIAAGQHVENYETVRIRKDGTLFPVSLTLSPIRKEGVSVGASMIVRDLTEPKRAEQAAEQNQALLRATMDSLLDPHVLLEAVRDEAGQIVDFEFAGANPAACEHTQKTYDELIGMRLLDLFPHAAEPGNLVYRYGRVVETGEPLVLDDYVYRQGLFRGQERRYDIRAAKVGDGLTNTWRDVTERHAAAQWLAESEEHYRLLAENASDVVMRLGPDRRYEWVSGSIADVLGWKASDLHGRVIDEFVHPAELAPFRQAVAGTGPEGTASIEFRFRRSDGRYRWVLCHTRLKADEDGTPVTLVGGLVDIDARKGVEAQELDRLAALERLQRLTVERELKMIELKKEIESLRSLVRRDGGEEGDKR